MSADRVAASLEFLRDCGKFIPHAESEFYAKALSWLEYRAKEAAALDSLAAENAEYEKALTDCASMAGHHDAAQGCRNIIARVRQALAASDREAGR